MPCARDLALKVCGEPSIDHSWRIGDAASRAWVGGPDPDPAATWHRSTEPTWTGWAERMDLGLSDRVYVVTGASGGLGRACAEQLVSEGARLVLSGRDETALAKTAASLGGSERAIPVSGDITDP